MTRLLARRALACAAATTALLATGAPPALSQSATSPGGPSLSQAPPVNLGSSKKHGSTSKHATSTAHRPAARRSATSTGRATRLPNTGYDAWAVALLGAGLIAAGLGLRLRVRDVRWP